MADITAADIKKLREITGAGMSDCKAALVETDGDLEKAVEILRIKGAKGVNKRAERTASNGLVTSLVEGDTKAVMLEINCETDFVAKSERFGELASEVLEHIAVEAPADVEALLGQPFVKDSAKTVREILDDANVALGEKIEVRRFVRVEGPFVASYLHKTSPDIPPTIGVLVELSGEDADLGKDLAQHIAFSDPRYLTREQVPQDIVDNERRIAEETAREEGKPEQALPRIVEGRLGGFFKDVVLLEQAFVKDNKKTIKQLATEAGVEIRSFARFRVGQA